MRLTAAEKSGSERVVFDVKSALEKDFESTQIQLLGSRKTNLATPSSDFDFYVSQDRYPQNSRARRQNFEKANRESEPGLLLRIAKDFENDHRFASVRHIFHGQGISGPMIRAVHAVTGAALEFRTGESPSDPSEQVKAWTSELPSLRALFISLRTYLDVNRLLRVEKGGVGSYALIVMIVTALRITRGPQFDPRDLGRQLVYVLKFWGGADLSRYRYTVDPPHSHGKRDYIPQTSQSPKSHDQQQESQAMDVIHPTKPEKPYLLTLQDPTNPQTNLGRNAFAIKEIQTLFNSAHAQLLNVIQTSKGSILASMIQADFTPFELARSQLAYPNAEPTDRYNRSWVLGRLQKQGAADYQLAQQGLDSESKSRPSSIPD